MADPNTIPFREADTNGHYKSKQLPQDSADFIAALGLPTYSGDVSSASNSTVGGEVTTYWGTTGHVIKADNHTGLAKLAAGILTSVTAPAGEVVGTTDTQTLINKTLPSPVITTPTGLTKYDVGLGNVDNTSDINKPPPSSVTSALATKEDKSNKGVTNGYASLDPAGKLPMSQVPDAIIGAARYQGTWNAATNSPAIPAAAPANNGYYYSVAVAGTTNINGIATWAVGDTIISNGSVWQKIPVSNAVQSVNGKTGIVAINANDVGLGNVDNTSDSTKNSASVALTNKTIDGATNTLNVRLNTTDVSGSLPVNKLAAGVNASSATFWRGDGQWVSPTGAGDVTGPGSSTDGSVVLFNGTTGKNLKGFTGAAGFAKLDTVGLVTTQLQMQSGDISAAMITGQTEKTVYTDGEDQFLCVAVASGALRMVRRKLVSSFPTMWFSGFEVANTPADLGNGIDIAAGCCRDESDTVDIRVSTGMTKKVNAAWAAGTLNGGLDTGTVSGGTAHYHIYVIMKADYTTDFLFTATYGTPTMPSGYVYKRRVASIVRLAAGFRSFTQNGDWFMLKGVIADHAGASNSANQTFQLLLGTSVPGGVKRLVSMIINFSNNTNACNAYMYDSDTTGNGTALFAAVANVGHTFHHMIVTNTASQVTITSGSQGGTYTYTGITLGYLDNRLRTK